MKNRNNTFTAVLLMLGCFALSSATQAAPSPPSPTNVNVVNTPNVNVANTTASPVQVRDVDNPARQPFHVQVVGGFADGASTTGDIAITTVPAGKLLIIEHISGLGSMLPGQNEILAGIRSGEGAQVKVDFCKTDKAGLNAALSRMYFVLSQPIRIYTNPGPVSCFGERDSFAGANPDSVTFTISGYFVDCPTCQ